MSCHRGPLGYPQPTLAWAELGGRLFSWLDLSPAAQPPADRRLFLSDDTEPQKVLPGISIFNSDNAKQHTSDRHRMQLPVGFGFATLRVSTEHTDGVFWLPGDSYGSELTLV